MACSTVTAWVPAPSTTTILGTETSTGSVDDTTIVDIDGGLPLGITEDLNEPGMILLFDQNGSLHLSDDVSDMEMYRINSYADERGE